MTCCRCGAKLERWEEPQPMVFQGKKTWPAAVCSDCARGYQQLFPHVSKEIKTP